MSENKHAQLLLSLSFGTGRVDDQDLNEGFDENSGNVGLPDNQISDDYTRTTIIIKKALLNKIRRIANGNGLNIKDLVEAGVSYIIERYEEKYGEVSSEDYERKTVKEILNLSD